MGNVVNFLREQNNRNIYDCIPKRHKGHNFESVMCMELPRGNRILYIAYQDYDVEQMRDIIMHRYIFQIFLNHISPKKIVYYI